MRVNYVKSLSEKGLRAHACFCSQICTIGHDMMGLRFRAARQMRPAIRLHQPLSSVQLVSYLQIQTGNEFRLMSEPERQNVCHDDPVFVQYSPAYTGYPSHG